MQTKRDQKVFFFFFLNNKWVILLSEVHSVKEIIHITQIYKITSPITNTSLSSLYYFFLISFFIKKYIYIYIFSVNCASWAQNPFKKNPTCPKRLRDYYVGSSAWLHLRWLTMKQCLLSTNFFIYIYIYIYIF